MDKKPERTTLTSQEIQRLRHKLGESAEAFGKRFGVTSDSVNNWEQEKRAVPNQTATMLLLVMWKMEGMDE